ncbi:MAG: hypothetical protein ABI702_16450 [Burkholderiales bacterium]
MPLTRSVAPDGSVIIDGQFVVDVSCDPTEDGKALFIWMTLGDLRTVLWGYTYGALGEAMQEVG